MLAGHTSAPGRAASQDPIAAHESAGKHTLVEAIAPAEPPARDERQQAARGVATPAVTFPHREMIQRLFGRHDLSSVRAHIDERSTGALDSHAFATGEDVVFAGPPDLHTAAHEAAHVIQQRGGAGHASAEHERHADEVADAVVRGQSAEPLLDRVTGGAPRTAVQHMKRRFVWVDPVEDRIDNLVNATLPHRNRALITALVQHPIGLNNQAVVNHYAGAIAVNADHKVAGPVQAVALLLHAKAAGQILALLGEARIASGAQLLALLDDGKIASGIELAALVPHPKLASVLQLQQLLGDGKIASGADLHALLQNAKVDTAAHLALLLAAPICPASGALVPFFADAHVPSLTEVRRVVARNEVNAWDAYWASRRNVTDTAATDRDLGALRGMTLAALFAHGEAQVDWHRGLASEQERAPIRLILGFLRNTAGALAGCGAWNTGDFWAAAGAGQAWEPTARQQAEAYARGVDGQVTCPVPRKATVQLGLAAGRDVLLLEAALGQPLCHAIFNDDEFDALHTSAHLAAFLNYVATCAPNLSAREGKEIHSYLALRRRLDPMTVHGALTGWVRNLHRFEAAALRALALAVADQTRARPVTVLIHSPLDLDGAFHRDPNLTDVIVRPNHLTLMIEGHGDLGSVDGRLDTIRDQYAPGNAIASVMLVGHGSTRAVNITGTTDNRGREHDTGLDLHDGDGRDFIRDLIDRMASGPNAHLVFNACHTDSTSVERTRDLGTGGGAAEDARRIREYLAANPSLSQFARAYAHQRGHQLTVHGANGATREGVEFLDHQDQLTLRDRDDPQIAGAKLAYVEHGQDPKGVMRAVLEVWAQDPRPPGLQQAMTRRAHADAPDFKEQLIRVVFRIVLQRYWDDAANIAHLIEAIGNLKKLRYPEDCTVLKLAAGGLGAQDFQTLYQGLQVTDDWRNMPFLPIVFHQRANRPGDVMTVLGQLRRPVRELVRRDRVYIAQAFDFATQLPLQGVAGATQAQLLLAIIGFKQHDDAHCRAYLNAYFVAVQGPLPGAGDYQVTRESLMRDLGPQVVVAQPQNANARAGGGGGNTVRLEPLTRRGRTNTATRAHEEPDETAPSVAVLVNHAMNVIGRMRGWIAAEDNGATRYLPAHTVDLL
jgi:hypothetical protein